MENILNGHNNNSNIHTPEPSTSPQVFSPLPIRTPVVHGVEINPIEFSNSNVELLDRDELYQRRFKCSKKLLGNFNEVANMPLEEEIPDNNRLNSSNNDKVLSDSDADFKDNNNTHENVISRFSNINSNNHNPNINLAIRRLPLRVGNPIINDENFLRNNQNIYHNNNNHQHHHHSHNNHNAYYNRKISEQEILALMRDH